MPELSVKKEKNKIWVFVDDMRHDIYLNHNDRVICLKNANKLFDAILESTAKKFKNHKYGSFTWIYTGEFIRGEEITGVVRWLYLNEIIKKIIKKVKITSINLKAPIPKSFYNSLLELKIPIAYNYPKYLWVKFRYIIGSSVRFLTIIQKNTIFLFYPKNHYHNGVLIDINESFTNNRYDNIYSIINKFPNSNFYSGQETQITGIPLKSTVAFRKEFDLFVCINSIFLWKNILSFYKKNRNEIPRYLADNLLNFNNCFQLLDILIYFNCLKKYFRNNNIYKIIHASTLTKPSYRMLMSIAKKHNIDFILVASRTLMKLRSSDRILECDVNGYNDTSLPTKYIFKDNYSRIVFEDFSEIKKKVKIGGRFLPKNHEFYEKNKPFACLLLFNHHRDICDKMLDELRKSGISVSIKTLVYRSHPLCPIKKLEIETIFPNSELIDISGKDYEELMNYRIISIAGPTTSALDAVQNGALILWLPYIWEDGILLDDIMNNLGIICSNQNDLKITFDRFRLNEETFFEILTKDQHFICKNFNTSNYISDLL